MIEENFIVDDDNFESVLAPTQFGQQCHRNTVPRALWRQPMGSGSSNWGTDIPLIPRDQWSERIKEMTANKSRLSDIRNTGDHGGPIKALDQNGQGYCWMYSGTAAIMLLRARDGLPHVRLSAHSAACRVKNFRDQGGWGAQGVEWLAEHGVSSVNTWPEKSMRRSSDNDASRADARKYRIGEGWSDIDVSQYDRELTFDQVATCLLSRIPVVLDYNWWSHSVCGMDLVETSPGQFAPLILNSWTNAWGLNGTGVLAGSKAFPDGASAPRTWMGS